MKKITTLIVCVKLLKHAFFTRFSFPAPMSIFFLYPVALFANHSVNPLVPALIEQSPINPASCQMAPPFVLYTCLYQQSIVGITLYVVNEARF